MRAVLEHSWTLLTDPSVIVQEPIGLPGGFRKEAAQGSRPTLQTLSTLVDKSLLRVNANGRYDLHEL